MANFTISGIVTLNSSALSGVTITLAGSQAGSITTTASGVYSFSEPAGGNYTVTPSLGGYTFSPPSANVPILSANANFNFAAATVSSYLKYLPPILWSQTPPASFNLGTMLRMFEKILTGIDDGVVITHGDNSVITTVTQSVIGSPSPQTIHVTAGTGTKFRSGSSYTYNGATTEVINITATAPNTITAVVTQNHAANQTIINSSGPHLDIQNIIASLVNLYGAWTTPSSYLPWLAQWVALQLDPAWDEYQSRSILSKIVGIYTQRGTKQGLDTFFDVYALAKVRPRVVVDDCSKVLFCAPQTGLVVPISALVSQQPLVAPRCMAIDQNGYLLVGDLGTLPASTFKPGLWRISSAGDYDYGAGPPSAPQPYQTAGLNLQAPLAVAADQVNGGAYLIDITPAYVLYRLTSPQVGAVALSGAPISGESAMITIGGTSYPLPQTGAFTLTQQAAAWAAALNGSITLTGIPTTGVSATVTVAGTPYALMQTGGNTVAQQATQWVTKLNSTASFSPHYLAMSSGAVITITTISGAPATAVWTAAPYLIPSFSANYTATSTNAVISISPGSGVPTDDLTLVTSFGSLILTVNSPLPASGSFTLSGTPVTGQSCVITVQYGSSLATSYTLNETTGFTLTVQAAAWVAILNANATFHGSYVATSSGAVITITPLTVSSTDDVLLITSSSSSLQLTAAGPTFGSFVNFTKSGPALGLELPIAMAVNSAGHPLILDRGALVADASKTAIVDVQIGAGPSYIGTARHALASIVEPLSMLIRADGSIVVGDAGNQNSASPADIILVNTTTWMATSLLGTVPAGSNPLVAPTGIVEVDAQHLMVVDAGLRPYYPYAGSAAFTVIIAQQAAIYSVDLSVAPPVIAQVSETQALVYPRGMVGDGNGTLYICDSGLPDLSGYNSQLQRSLAQQFTVVVHFPGNPSNPIFSVAVSGTPASGEQCSITISGTVYSLPEVTGDSIAVQAAAWASALNANTAFNPLYIAIGVGNIICIYGAPQTNANGSTIAVTSSAGVTLIPGLLAMVVALSGTPTTGDHGVVNVGGSAYMLTETTGDTLAQQATGWATTLNTTASFNQNYVAVASGDVIAISYKTTNSGFNPPSFVTSVGPLVATGTLPPFFIGTVTLMGTPTTSESCVLTVGLASYTLNETTGNTVAQQAAAWCVTLNGTPSFNASYIANNSAGVVNIFAVTALSIAASALSAVSSAHLNVTSYSELQNRQQFLQSIDDVVNDEIPAQAGWSLQSELS